jgi:hypothetical protein
VNKYRSEPSFSKARWLIATLLLAASAAQADVFHVTSNADFGAGTLRDAIDQANANAGPDEITFAEALGTITVTGQMEISDTLTITGPAGGQVISGDGQTRILAVTTEDTPLTLENLVLTDGLTTATGQSPFCGETDGNGGALCSNSAVHLSRVTIQNSRTQGSNADGGGARLFVGGTITDSIIRNNRVEGTSTDGGGLRAGGELIVHNTLIEGNQTLGGGGSWGGGLVMHSGTTFNMTDSAVINNSSSGGSGGLRVSRTLMENSVVSGNSAQVGGGMSIDLTFSLAGNPGAPVIRNSTISDNRDLDPDATFGGGLRAIFYQIDYVLRLESVIVAGNTGPAGNFNMTGATLNPGQDTAQVTVDVVHSLFGDDSAEINGQNLNNVFSDNPRLRPLADLGCAVPAGATGTEQCVPVHAFMAGSPAVNAGSNPEGLEFDQRGPGFPRVNDGQADIGSYESNDGLFADRFEEQP